MASGGQTGTVAASEETAAAMGAAAAMVAEAMAAVAASGSVRTGGTPSAVAAHDRRREVIVVGLAAVVREPSKPYPGTVDLQLDRPVVRVVTLGAVRGVDAEWGRHENVLRLHGQRDRPLGGGRQVLDERGGGH